MITKSQYDFLTQALNPNRVSQRQGQSHLEAWDVRRHLIRVFGFCGFDIERRDLALVKEIETPPSSPNGKTRWTVVYRVELRLIIKAPDGAVLAFYDDGATGDAINQPSIGDAHDFALKTAYSQALKRCAVNLGDQYGLSLYNGGNPAPVVHRSLVVPEGVEVTAPPVDTTPVQPEPEPSATEPPPTEPATNSPPTAPDPIRIRDWVLANDRTADGLDAACLRLQAEHPQVAAAMVVNEIGDQEQLQSLLARRAHELALARSGGSGGGTQEERCRKRMHALFAERGYRDRDARLSMCALAVGRDITTTTDLTFPEVGQVIASLERLPEGAAA